MTQVANMHRINRRRVEIAHYDALDSDNMKEGMGSQAWAMLKCGCAVVTAVLLALVVVAVQRAHEAPHRQALHFQDLLAQQRIAQNNQALLRGPTLTPHQLKLQSSDLSRGDASLGQIQHFPAATSDFGDPHEEEKKPVDGKRVIWSTTLANNDVFEVVDEFIPADCMAQANTDYDGPAVRWGLHPAPKVRSAAACCQLCKDWKPNPQPCNVWVFCPDPSGLCWSADIWNHTTGECWLKFQADWDENPIIANSNVQVVHKGRFSPAYRNHHKTAPEWVPWMSGTIIGTKNRG